MIKSRKTNDANWTITRYIAFSTISLVLVVGVVAYIWHANPAFSQRAEAEQEYAEVQEMTELQERCQQIEFPDIPEALASAKQTNTDVCAWVYFPNTNVSLPILQSVVNERKYVDESFDGAANVLGATFIEAESSPLFIDPVTIVYGHAFEDFPDVMLGQLHKFKDEKFFIENDTFYIITEEKQLQYRIVSACEFQGDHVPTLLKIAGEGAVQKYMDFVANPGCDPAYVRDVGKLDAHTDRIVQFSTCTMPSSAQYRYIVTGVLVNENLL